MIVMCIGTIYHAIMVYVLYSILDWGFYGVCWATGTMFLLKGLIAQVIVKFSKRFQKFDDVSFFSRETFSNIGPLIAIDLKSVAMTIWGWWAFDFFTLMASYLGPDEVATQTIMRSIGLLTFMIPIGFATSLGFYTGKSLGDCKPKVANMYYLTNMICAVFCTTLTITFLYYMRDGIIRVYTR